MVWGDGDAPLVAESELAKRVARRGDASLAGGVDGATMYCARCNAVWRQDELVEADPRCLICAGPLIDLEPG